jgi:intracellular sulfur oxidation DsrE/DsrF family protein
VSRFSIRLALALALFIPSLTGVSWGQEKERPKKLFPVIEGYGGVFPLQGEEGPRKGSKVVFDVTGDAKEAGQAVPGLERAALLYNLAGRDGIKPADLNVAVVLHGSATKYALSDAAFQAQFGKPNPNAELIRRLTKAGAKVYVCGQSVVKNGFEPKSVAGEVKVASSALTAVINKQSEGYACVPAP